MDDEYLVALRRRYSAFGLLRFAAGWGVVLSIVGAIIGWWGGWITLVICVIVIGACTASMRTLRAQAATYSLLYTAEGQQAIRDEATRRLREGDY